MKQFANGRPGKDWFKAFMKRNNLSLKKANMISVARKSATGNPFVINDFYDILEKAFEKNNYKPEQIWNCDESGFPNDPGKCKVVSVKGKTAFKVTCGARRENITTLAVVNAAGRALDPLVIFGGKNMQSTWQGDKALPKTFYGISETGWMTSEVFVEWFNRFCELVKERPLLLIFDGHMTHVTLGVIEKAVEENVVLLKLPPHATDVLQPLDVSCFGPLKRLWEQRLNAWINEFGVSEPIRKGTFVNKLCEVWHQGLSASNIKAGFECTGIFPIDRKKYPEHRYDARLLKRYNVWVAAGKPEDLQDELATAISTPKKLPSPLEETISGNNNMLISCKII